MRSTTTFLALILALAGLSFNLAEAAAQAPLPRTGQTPTTPLNPAPPGADGALEKGVDWPSPRFIDNGDGTVRDTLTDLYWLKNANCTDTVGGVKKNVGTYPGALNWAKALTWSNALAEGNCGLTDGSLAGEWRLPNLRELHSLVDLGQAGPALPAGHPFQNVLLTRNYWSSSTDALLSTSAWNLNLGSGDPGRNGKTGGHIVWPVRDAIPPRGLEIGYNYQGGIVFYIDDSGQHGLIAAPQDQSTGIAWGAYPYDRVYANGYDVGTGQANTIAIIAHYGVGDYAASLADNLMLNGYSDWFLPSMEELNLMYLSIGPGAPAPLTNIGGFSSAYYWSSSEWYSPYYQGRDGWAWAQNFGDGGQYVDKGGKYDVGKNGLLRVRAVRAF